MQTWEDRLIVKVIWFSVLTSMATVIWYEVVGIGMVVILIPVILGIKLRRYIYEKNK